MNLLKLFFYRHQIFLLLFLTKQKTVLGPGIYTGTIFVAPFLPPRRADRVSRRQNQFKNWCRLRIFKGSTNSVVDPLTILTENVVFLQSEKSFLKSSTERSTCHRSMIWVSNMLLMIKGTRCKKVNDHMSPLTIFRRGNVILVCIFIEIFRFERRKMLIFTWFNWRAPPVFGYFLKFKGL